MLQRERNILSEGYSCGGQHMASASVVCPGELTMLWNFLSVFPNLMIHKHKRSESDEKRFRGRQ